VILIFRDVSERRQDEDRLRQSEAQFRQLADALPQLVWTARPDGFTDYYNQRWYEFTGMPRNELGDGSWTPILHPDDVQASLGTWYESVRTGNLYQIEYRFKDRRTGGYRWFLGRAYPVRNEQGQIVRWFGTCTDIDETKRAEQASRFLADENTRLVAALKESDRRKDEFLAMLAHELRNPLAPIRNGVQIFRAKAPPVPELQWATEVIDRQVHQMTRLIDDLLDLSRITLGKIDLRKERVELATVVSSAVEASRPLIEKWGHELSVTIPPQPIPLEADLTRLSQVLMNLLNNSAKYMDRAGHIWVIAEREDGDVLIRVRDTGIGIPAEMLPRIFDMFTQVDRSLERSEGGLGIGLTLVRQLVEMHGGTVEAHSEGPGQGSEFVVRLPIAATDGDLESGQAAGGAEKAVAPATRRILVVDDNRDAAESLGMLLSMMGNEIHTVHDGLEAVKAVAAFRPDVVLLDIGMPKLNGYEAARRIRQQPEGAGVVLIALTGWGQEDDRRRSREAGFDHHLTKPVEFADLQKLLAETIPSHPNR